MPSPLSYRASIIAIHGLDGHREDTWTAENGTLWLRDCLSVDIPNARILVYGYDADTRSRECVSTQTIYQHADKLVKSAARERIDAPRVSTRTLPAEEIPLKPSQRPIIFIAHSLGGIVLKQVTPFQCAESCADAQLGPRPLPQPNSGLDK